MRFFEGRSLIASARLIGAPHDVVFLLPKAQTVKKVALPATLRGLPTLTRYKCDIRSDLLMQLVGSGGNPSPAPPASGNGQGTSQRSPCAPCSVIMPGTQLPPAPRTIAPSPSLPSLAPPFRQECSVESMRATRSTSTSTTTTTTRHHRGTALRNTCPCLHPHLTYCRWGFAVMESPQTAAAAAVALWPQPSQQLLCHSLQTFPASCWMTATSTVHSHGISAARRPCLTGPLFRRGPCLVGTYRG